jgi:hypothetical protein
MMNDVLTWIRRDFYRFSGEDHIDVCNRTDSELKVILYTDVNKYTIVAKNTENSNYLGAVGGSRKPRAGENHTRGNDLADGPLDEKTWERIKNDIISFELVRIRRNNYRKDTPGPL